MLTPVSRVLLAITLVATATGALYWAVVDERAGTTLLLVLAVAALVATIATAGASVADQALFIPADAPPPERRATTTGSPPRGSAWPAGAAVAVAAAGVTAAVGGPVVLVGVIAIVIAAMGWFGKVWSEDPTWTPRLHERVSLRLLVPVGLPVLMFALAATIAISLSRILLAVDKNMSVLIAFVAAVAILGACSWVATRPRVTSSAVLALVGLAVVATAGAGITGVAAGEREFHPHEGHGEVVHLHAEEVKFDTDKITVKAGEEVTVDFLNSDIDVYHNLAVYEGDGPDAPPIFNGEGFAGDDERVYTFKAPPPGAYVFVCDFHPNMKGT
ncbi:MAG: cupredoxin domain-containing protein, partial [Acidimicrobiales bacterium]